MKILKYPQNVIHCNCGCTFAFGKDDVRTEVKGIQRDERYVFFVDCPVCDCGHTLDSSKVNKPYPIDNEDELAMCKRVFDDLVGG